jgi:hypothetical protein
MHSIPTVQGKRNQSYQALIVRGAQGLGLGNGRQILNQL